NAVLRRARIVLAQVSVAVVAASLVVGAWNLARVLKSSEADQRVAEQIGALNREAEEIKRATPSYGVGGATMRDAVAVYNVSMRGFPTLVEFVGPLSQALRTHPDVRLTQIAWQATDDAKATPRMQATTARNAPPVKALARGPEPGQQAQTAEEGANPPFAGG